MCIDSQRAICAYLEETGPLIGVKSELATFLGRTTETLRKWEKGLSVTPEWVSLKINKLRAQKNEAGEKSAAKKTPRCPWCSEELELTRISRQEWKLKAHSCESSPIRITSMVASRERLVYRLTPVIRRDK